MSDRFSTEYGVYQISNKPGLPQVAICHGFYILDGMRGKGFGHKLMAHMISTLYTNQYDFAVCTTAGDNDAMQTCLSKAGWKQLSQFHNRKSGKSHQMWGFVLFGSNGLTSTSL